MPIYCQGMEKRSFLLFRVSKWPLSFDVSPTFQHKDSLREFPGDGSALLTPQHPATSSFIQQSWCIAHQSPPVTLATLLGDAFQIIVNAMPPAHWTHQLSPQITLQTISLWHVLIQSSAPPVPKPNFLLSPANRGQVPPLPYFLTTTCSVLLDFGTFAISLQIFSAISFSSPPQPHWSLVQSTKSSISFSSQILPR